MRKRFLVLGITTVISFALGLAIFLLFARGDANNTIKSQTFLCSLQENLKPAKFAFATNKKCPTSQWHSFSVNYLIDQAGLEMLNSISTTEWEAGRKFGVTLGSDG